MAVVLADVVVVVKRCKEERSTCPYISLYTPAPLVFPRLYIRTHKYLLSLPLPPALPSSLSSGTALNIPHNNHPPTKQHILANDKHSQLPTLNIAPQSMLTFPLTRTLYYFHLQTASLPLPPLSALSPKSSPERPKQKEMQGGRAEFKKTSRVQCMPSSTRGLRKKNPSDVTQGVV